MRQFFIICAFLLLSTSGFTQQTINGTITHNNVEREYILYVPANYTGSAAVPLVFNFHGYRFTAENQMNYGDFRSIADREGFILVHPQGTLLNGNTHWNVGAWTTGSNADDIGFSNTLLDFLISEYNIDVSRIYSAGFSNGGVFSFRLACRLSNRFAAVASVGGSMTPFVYNSCFPSHPTPIMQIHGTNDNVIPYNGIDWSWSIDELLEYWTGYNNGNTTPVTEAVPNTNTNDFSTVEHIVYGDGDNGTSVEHFKVSGGMHTWPGTQIPGNGTNQDINASEEIWKFFSRYDINGAIIETSIGTLDEVSTTVNIYPNPAISSVNIEVDFDDRIDFILKSLSGEIIHSDFTRSNQFELDLLPLPAGIYILEIKGQNYKIQKI